MSDLHVGNANTDINAIKQTINDARRNEYGVMILGDLCESKTSRSNHFDMGTIDKDFLGDDMIGSQYRTVEKLLKPIADQILLIHSGNHDSNIAKYCHIDMVASLCENLGVKYSQYSALSRLTYTRSGKKNSYIVYTTHGYASGRMRGGKVNALESLSSSISSDVFYAGHSHDLFCTSNQQMYLTRYGNLGFRNLYYCNTGSYLRGIVEGQNSYAEMRGYRPLKIGYIKTTFNPREYGIKIEEVPL